MSGAMTMRRARLAGAVALALLGGCSSPNELMIAVQTDLSVPDDIDTIQLEVWSGGTQKFERSFCPDPTVIECQAELKHPLTLGLVSDEAGAPVQVRLIAFTGGDIAGAPRILREVETTIPAERLALLQIPLHYLCDGSAAPTSDGSSVTNAVCGAGETCIAGTCAPAAVDSASLPDYAPEDVFGGGAAVEDGKCFDVSACFAAATEVTVDTADCSFVADGDVNVALRTTAAGTSAGDGFCIGAEGCLVVLDEGDAGGYQQSSGGRIQLPPGVCDKLGATGVPGRVDGVVTAPAQGDCAKKRIGLPVCQAGAASQ